MQSHLTGGLLEFVARWLPEPPAPIIDVGCGDGESTEWLRRRGHDAIGVDPEAPNGADFERTRIQDLAPAITFDAGLALRSLHHVGDLDGAVEAIAEALERGGHLVVFEFAIEAVDDRALAWCAAHGLRTPTHPGSAPEVAPLAAVRGALAARFEELAFEAAPYLARELGEPELEPDELAAIESGRLDAAGARLAYARL
ncbi:MAG: class I SAM-dependent methyltransferase [Solirubrobacterales bacterium]